MKTVVETIANIDGSDTHRIPDVVDVVNWRHCKVQLVSHSGDLTGLVVEAMITYDHGGHHRESFSTSRTVDHSGAVILQIDTTDIAFISFNVTTAKSGASFDLVVSMSRPMRGAYDVQTIRCDDVAYVGMLNMQKHQIQIYTHATLNNSAGLEVRRSLISEYPQALPTALDLPIDDGYGKVIRDSDDILPLYVDAAQAGQILQLHIYGRDEVPNDPSLYAGTDFPPDPYDGQSYRYIGSGLNELFQWDATRGKWLGTLRMWAFSRSGAFSSGSFQLRVAGAEYWTSVQGIPSPFQMTWVGFELVSKIAFTGNVEAREGSVTSLGTHATGSSSTIHSTYDIDIDFDADASTPHKWWRMNVSTGTCDDVVGTVYVQRSYTPG